MSHFKLRHHEITVMHKCQCSWIQYTMLLASKYLELSKSTFRPQTYFKW